MRDAKLDGKPVLTGLDSPDVAQCPACGGEVRRRRRRVGRSEVTYFYRHRIGSDDCPRRYRPVAEG